MCLWGRFLPKQSQITPLSLLSAGKRSISDTEMSFESSDDSVVKVSKDGKLTAVAGGKAKITVKAGELVKSFTVTVK